MGFPLDFTLSESGDIPMTGIINVIYKEGRLDRGRMLKRQQPLTLARRDGYLVFCGLHLVLVWAR